MSRDTFTTEQLNEAATRTAAAAAAGDVLLVFRAEDVVLRGAEEVEGWCAMPQPRRDLVGIVPPPCRGGGDELFNRCHAAVTKSLARRRNALGDWGGPRPSLSDLNSAARALTVVSEQRERRTGLVAMTRRNLRALTSEDLLDPGLETAEEVLWVSLAGLPTDWEGALGQAGIRILTAWAVATSRARTTAPHATDGPPPLRDAA